MPTPPGVWSEPSATTTPLSSSARTGGVADCCRADPGEITAATPPRASAATSSSVAACSRSADAQPSSAATRAAPLRAVCPQACSRGSSPARRPALRIQRASSSREPAVLAVDVHAVRADGGGVRAPGRHRVDVVAAAAEELGRHHLRRVERDVHPRHARLVLQRAEHPHVGQLAVPGEVVAGLRLDRGGARLQPGGEPLAHVVAEGPGVGAPGHGDRGGDAAARRGDLRVRQAGGAHGQLRVAVARVDRVRVRVDQAGGDQAAAQVLHQVDVDDVVDDAGDAARQLGRRADPGDPVIADQDGGIADDLGPGPEPADAGEQPGGHRVIPSCRRPRGSDPAIMSGHLPCMLDVGADRAYLAIRTARSDGWHPIARPVLHIGSVTVLHRRGSLQAPSAKALAAEVTCEYKTGRSPPVGGPQSVDAGRAMSPRRRRIAAAQRRAPAARGPRGRSRRGRARSASPRPPRAPGPPGRPGCRGR